MDADLFNRDGFAVVEFETILNAILGTGPETQFETPPHAAVASVGGVGGSLTRIVFQIETSQTSRKLEDKLATSVTDGRLGRLVDGSKSSVISSSTLNVAETLIAIDTSSTSYGKKGGGGDDDVDVVGVVLGVFGGLFVVSVLIFIFMTRKWRRAEYGLARAPLEELHLSELEDIDAPDAFNPMAEAQS